MFCLISALYVLMYFSVKMMSGSKAPDFYAHIGDGSKGLSPTYEQAHMGLDLLTLAS